MNLLRTIKLKRHFGDTRAVDEVDLTVTEGEFLSLVGSNGAGKTTLVNLISAYLRPDGGQILLYDQDITFSSVYDRMRAGIARSFQLVNLFDDMSAFDNVALAIFSREGKTHNPLRLAARDQAVIDVDVDGFPDLAVQLEHAARAELQQLGDRHRRAAQHRRDRHRHVEDGRQVGGGLLALLFGQGSRQVGARTEVFEFEVVAHGRQP